MKKDEWKVRAVGVSYVSGERREKPLEDYTEAELRRLRESGREKNLRALEAAGYVPVAESDAVAM